MNIPIQWGIMETLQNSYDSLMNTLAALGDITIINIIVIILVVLIAQRIAHNFMTKIINRTIGAHKFETEKEQKQREDTLISVFDTAVMVILWIVAVLLILRAIGIDIAALATGAGLIGVIIGFGAQSTIKDFLKGFFIILENQYRVGDIVTLNDRSGVVESLTIRITRLRDLDGYTHILSNGDITNVTNMSFGHANVNINIGVSYNSDIQKVESTINTVGLDLAGDDKWKSDFIEPIQFLRVDAFSDSAVVIKSLGKVAPGRQWDIAGEFRRRIKIAFEQAGIEIPYQQIVIHQSDKTKK